MELRSIGDVGEQLPHRRDTIRGVSASREHRGHSFEELVKVANKKVILVVVVHIESRPADLSTIKDVLYGDRVERLLQCELHKCVTEPIASAPNTPIDLPFYNICGHRKPFCSFTTRL